MTNETPAAALTPLSPADRLVLLRLAREAIACAIAQRPEPGLAAPTPPLLEMCGAFVSLHEGEALRGCVGTLETDRPLWMTVRRLAVAAAFDDPRFAPVNAPELNRLSIEISRLTPLTPARPEDIVPGRHGVCVERGYARGVFLPQVATKYGWTRDILLTEVCIKAGLPADAWRDPSTQITRFEADIIAE